MASYAYRDGGFLCALLFGVGVKEDISASPLTVLVDYQPDLTGLQLGDWPATSQKKETEKKQVNTIIVH